MKYAFTNGMLIDGTKDMEPISGKTVFTDGEKIEKIADAGASTEGYEAIDLKGA